MFGRKRRQKKWEKVSPVISASLAFEKAALEYDGGLDELHNLCMLDHAITVRYQDSFLI